MAQIPKPDPNKAAQYFQNKLDFTTGPIEVSHWLEAEAPIQIIDVRRKEDYEKGHVPNAINIPQEKWGNPEGLSKDKTNVLYCYSQTCHLAASAAVQFARKGFSVIEMEGGFNIWQKAGLEVSALKI